MILDEELADDIMSTYASMKSHRSNYWDPAWRALAQLLFAREPTILWGTGSKKWRPNNKMFDRTGAESLITAASGLTSQWMSPARPWMKLTVEDPKLADRQSVRIWLEGTTKDMLGIFARSNVYAAMGRFVRDILWATPVCYIEEDDESVLRLYPEEVGGYVIGKDEKGKPNVVIREFALSAKNIRRKFPKADLPTDVMNALRDTTHGLTEFPVIHYVGPNPDMDESAFDYRSKKYISCYLVCDKILSKSGYEMFPYLVGQWDPEGEDVYSVTPALNAFGDMRSLQQYAKGKLKVAEKLVDPALAVPASVSDVRREPGSEVTVSGGEKIQNLEEIKYDWNGVQLVTSELKESVRRAFFTDLFQHFLNSTRREQTAEEVRAKLEEQYAALGPIVSSMNQNIAAHLIDVTFAIMVRKKLLRPPPPELVGVTLKVQYMSEFERAQQASALRQLQAYSLDLVNLAPIIQNPPDQVDVDEILQKLAEYRQIPETIVRDDYDIADRRKAKAQLIQDQLEQQKQQNEAATIQALGKARTTPDTALGQLQG